MPRRSRSAAWAASGWVTQRKRILPCVVVGKITSLDWIVQLFEDCARRISKACALLPHLEALPQNEARKHTRIWA